jgi:glycosyltransferase involved in cell wall biosynthesis
MPEPAVILVPTYNERDTIVRCLEALWGLQGVDVAIIDDDSPDGTAAEVRRYLEARQQTEGFHERVRLIVRNRDRGFARSYLEGFRWALDSGYSSVVTLDADLSHPVDRIPALLQKTSEGADVAIGSRYIPGGQVVGWGFLRRFISRFGNLVARARTRSGVSDMTSGFMALKRDALAVIIEKPIMLEGYSFLILLKVRARRARLRIVEVPITFTDREQGRSKFGWTHIAEAVRALWSGKF